MQDENSSIDPFPRDLFIGGAWRPADGGRRFEVEDPATGEVLGEVSDAGPADGTAALDAAVTAQAGWAATPPRERGDVLRRAFDAVMAGRDRLARLMTFEMGKPLRESLDEVAYGAEFLRWYAEEAVRIDGRFAMSPAGDGRLLTMRQPVGPCLFITPWNFPLAMGTRKIGPAVAAGCTMVVKPAQQTPLSMLALAEILAEAGLPDGVLNVIPTSEPAAVTTAILGDVRLRKVSFTGSTAVGKHLMAASAANVLRTSMELGGNAPFLVLADADVDAAVEGAMMAKLRNMGQACTAANRFLVHESLADAFSAALVERMRGLRVGRGIDEGVHIGPLIEEPARARVHDLVVDAADRGARISLGGEPMPGPGYFYPPTVLQGVSGESRVLHEEAFGPVAPITTFSTEEEAVAACNDTEYGLVAYLYARDLSKAFRVLESLEVGMVGLNTGKVSNAAAPFGGVKHSGVGREGGQEGIAEYLETKYVSMPV